MSVSDLEKFMLSGKIQPGFEEQVLHLMDETPTTLVAGAVKQLAEKKHVSAKLIWNILAQAAAEIKPPNKIWSVVG